MADAFRTGEGLLTPDVGEPARLSFKGYTTGSDTAYFEVIRPDTTNGHAPFNTAPHASP